MNSARERHRLHHLSRFVITATILLAVGCMGCTKSGESSGVASVQDRPAADSAAPSATPAPTKPVTPPVTPTQPATPDQPAALSRADEAAYQELMDRARQAMLRNEYSEAAKLCAEALGYKPGDEDANTMCGLAACGMRDGALAKKYADQVQVARRTIIRQQCLKFGVPDIK